MYTMLLVKFSDATHAKNRNQVEGAKCYGLVEILLKTIFIDS